jgi:dephospho-CoA kinase
MDEGQTEKTRPVRGRASLRTGPFFGCKTLVVGLTGGVATGKTTVARMLADLGAEVISADEVVHKMLEDDEDLRREIVKQFGSGIMDERGRIDRRRLGGIVFRDPGKRRRLEQIIHPPVLARMQCRIEEFRKSGRGVLVAEIPLLVETSSIGMVDKVLLVSAEQDTQIQRLQKRHGISHAQAVLRVKSQLPIDAKKKYADWIVHTEGSMQATREQVERVWEAVQKRLAQRK